MDANSRKVLGLISEMNVRFQVPVYQRPYSWGHAQCQQLWQDILAVGRSRVHTHFTGSIVTIQDGELSGEGVATMQLIDGQQRLTTISLLLMALARFAEAHPERSLSFTSQEIVFGGYLTNRYRTGADHYKLTLSKNDRACYQGLVDALEQGSAWESDQVSVRIWENLAFFEARLEALQDTNSVWAGLQRLEVVDIALSQGSDDPQVIFESMNSTGKDLSTADLVRNFVLMSYPLKEQAELYRIYWQPLERMLGEGTDFDASFDEFLSCYLAIVHAPASVEGLDIYQAFKRYVLFMGFNEHDRMKNLCLRLKRFCGYFCAVTKAGGPDSQVTSRLSHIADLKTRAATPLLVSLMDAYDHHELTRDELLGLLDALESYLVRRLVCGLAPSAMVPFLASLVARAEAVRNEEGDLASALNTMLAIEDGSPRRFPTDSEFAHALSMRDLTGTGEAPLILRRLEEELSGTATDEHLTLCHIMPVRALAGEGWHKVLGQDAERAFQDSVNALGNLTLTKVAYDAPEATFAERLEQVRADGLALTADVASADSWTPEDIRQRTERLRDVALRLWRRPLATDGTQDAYRLTERAGRTRTVTFADLFAAGLVEMDDALVSVSPLYPGRASVTSTGKIMLSNGEMFEDPTAAYERFLATLGAEHIEGSGWMHWRRGDGGPLLDDLRAQIL